jgi:chromosome segregation ATPase
MTINLSKILLSIVLLLAAIYGVFAFQQRQANIKINALQVQIQKLESEREVLSLERATWKAKAEGWENKANEFDKTAQESKALADAAMTKVKLLEAKLKNLPKSKPPANPKELPHDQVGLVNEFIKEGFSPIIISDPKGLAFTTQQSIQLLAYTKDAKNYPAALERIAVMGNEINALNEVVNAKEDAINNLEKENKARIEEVNDLKLAESTCQKEIVIQKEITDKTKEQKAQVEKQLNSEKYKKWVTFGFGLLAGLLLVIL